MTIPGSTVSGSWAWLLRTVETALTFFVGVLAEQVVNQLHDGHITNTAALYNALWAALLGAILATVKHFTGLTFSNVWGAAPAPLRRR